MVQHMQIHYRLSLRQACKAVSLPRSTYHYEKQENPVNQRVMDNLSALVEKHPSIGFWKSYYRLRRSGHNWNHKRVYRIYTKMKLNIRRKSRKRLPARVKEPLLQPSLPNQTWSMDFMQDSLWNGRKYRLLNIIDDHNRAALVCEVDTSLPALRVIRALERLIDERGTPSVIRVDNGPEFISQKLKKWCEDHHIQLRFIQPGKPTQNAFIERFNGSMRREVLDAYIFTNLDQARQVTQQWIADYNQNRPHKSLGYKTPNEYAA